MGHDRYSFADRTVRAATLNYMSADSGTIFTQTAAHRIHESMDPKGVKMRESCDSEAHPKTVPIQFYLDVTGSMGSIPLEMVRTGLPKLIGNLITNGVTDVALMFGAIGDHESDQAPFQIAQFESGDAQLDMWLTRTWLEGNGGGNAGESYLLAWYFAGNHVRTDAFDKRGQKGFVFTIGDEPCLRNLPMHALKGIMGEAAVGQGNGFTREDLLAKAQEQNHVFHIHFNHGRRVDPAWKEMLGQNLIEISSQDEVAHTISQIVLSYAGEQPAAPVTTPFVVPSTDEEML